tara:strand:+ start:965 stop:1114 length:150 start_codon:yes stop_codon:yes gene_type:complete
VIAQKYINKKRRQKPPFNTNIKNNIMVYLGDEDIKKPSYTFIKYEGKLN